MENTPISTIERRYNELNSKWTMVQEAHDAYMAVLPCEASKDIESEEANPENWINDIADRCDAIELEADRSIEALKLIFSQNRRSNSTYNKSIRARFNKCQYNCESKCHIQLCAAGKNQVGEV